MAEELRKPALIASAGFSALLGFFLVFRTILMLIPIDVVDPFQKSAIGTLTALALLLLQPFACRFVATRTSETASAASWAFAGGVLSSLLLLPPALILFME
jgi:dolichol kinase